MIEAACPNDAPRASESYEETRKAHAACMVCGEGRAGAPAFGLRFVLDSAGGVQATFRTASRYQGYQGILHGGVISTLLDAAMDLTLRIHADFLYDSESTEISTPAVEALAQRRGGLAACAGVRPADQWRPAGELRCRCRRGGAGHLPQRRF